jgi:hypothetical protein
MYTIYHVPGIKVGCSKRLEKRIKEQGFTEYEILEVCTTISEATEREVYWQGRLGYKPDSLISYAQTLKASTPESKEKFKQTIKKSELWKAASSKRVEYLRSQKGKTRSEATKIKMKEAWERKRVKGATPRKKYIRGGLNGYGNKKKAVKQLDLQGSLIKEWLGMVDAGRALGIDPACITACCKGKQKTAGKFIWKYKNV